MGSVVITWEGRSPDRGAREGLASALEPFALASNALLPEPIPPLRFDGPVEGTALILLPPVVAARLNRSFEEREETSLAVQRAGGSLIPPCRPRILGASFSVLRAETWMPGAACSSGRRRLKPHSSTPVCTAPM